MRRAVVIPHRIHRDLLLRALAAVADEDVWVVDDSDAGGLSDLFAGQPEIRVVRTAGGVGFARAANAGLAAVERDGFSHAVVLNDDAEPESGCLDALAAAWCSDTGAVGPVMLGPHGVESAGMRLAGWGRVRVLVEVPTQRPVVPVDGLAGACILLASAARFDEAYRHGMEDLALCRDLRRRGLGVLLVAEARCRHQGGATVPRASRAAQRHGVAGHLRLVGGGVRTPIVLGLAAAQVARERGPLGRLVGIAEGWRDFRRSR